MLVLNILNIVFGEFNEQEIKSTLGSFYSSEKILALKRISALLLIAFLIWAISFVIRDIHTWSSLIAFTICMGFLTGCFIVTLAHDLLHSKYKSDQNLAAALLIGAFIPHLAGDHVYGHHRFIGLPDDDSTAKINQSFYSYFFVAAKHRLYNSFTNQLALPKPVLKKLRKNNILMALSIVSVIIGLVIISPKPFYTVAYYVGQGMIAYVLYELINYIQHYGLKREHGQSISIKHSWNCYYKYTNYFLFMLPMHSLHHLPAHARRVPLEQMKAGPKMPYLYFTMTMLALIPPLWFRIMNPQVKQIHEA